MNEVTWLSISLFCDRRIAHRVLKDGVLPFIIKCQANNSLRSWFFEFNSLSGENIRLALLVPAMRAATIAIDTKAHFTFYFEQQNFPQTPLHFPLSDLFLPFPENSIQFGLHDIEINEKKKTYDFAQRTSEVLIDALVEDEIYEDAVLTLCLYVNFILKKIVMDICPNNMILLKSIYINDVMAKTSISVPLEFQKKLEDNRYIIQAIWDDIYDSDCYKQQPWLAHWKNLCTEAISSGDFQSNVNTLIRHVNKQLDISLYHIQLICYLVTSTWDMETGTLES